MQNIEDVIENDTTIDPGDKAFLLDTLWMLRAATTKRQTAAGPDLVAERIRARERLAGVTLQSGLKDAQRARLVHLLREHVEDLGERIEQLLRAG